MWLTRRGGGPKGINGEILYVEKNIDGDIEK
jgi:hypothetical protein